MPELGTLEEITIDGPRTRRWVLEASECRELGAHRIARLGFDETLPPYRRVRLQPEGSFVLACVSGHGQVLLDGRWQKVGAGTVCMAPPRVLNAFHSESRDRWVFAWIRYAEPSYVSPLVGASSPVVVSGGAGELARTIEGLRAEWEGQKDPKLLHHWIELAQASARRLAQPYHMHERLWKLWETVAGRLEEVWTLEQLARHFHSSVEQLRRLSHRELGRSPMQHLTYMRMQRAQRLLESADDKLEIVAASVGYANAFVFSRAFKRWVGCAPADYRRRR